MLKRQIQGNVGIGTTLPNQLLTVTGSTGVNFTNTGTGLSFIVNDAAGDTSPFVIDSDGAVFIGDTANGNNIAGLTINQANNVDEILSFKETVVAHGVTDLTETDTFGLFATNSLSSGGLQLYGLGESSQSTGLRLHGIAGKENTSKTTFGLGYITIDAKDLSGTTTAAPGADANLMVIRSLTTTRFIFDQEGTAHADDVWTDSVFDLAEEYDVSETVEEGTILTIGINHDNRLSPSSAPYQVVTGIVSYHTAQLQNSFNNIMDKYPQKLPHHIFTYSKDVQSSPNAEVANKKIDSMNNKNANNRNLINNHNNNGNFGTGQNINEQRAHN